MKFTDWTSGEPVEREWMRADPDYDDPLPSLVSMLPAAIVVVIVGTLLLGLALAVLAGPEVR